MSINRINRITGVIAAVIISMVSILGIAPAASASHGVPGAQLPTIKVIDHGRHLLVTPRGSVMIFMRYGDYATGNTRNLALRPAHKPYTASTLGLKDVKYYFFAIVANGKIVNMTKPATLHLPR